MTRLDKIDIEYREIGPTTEAVYRSEFRRAESPLLPHAEAMHAAAGEHSALALAMMWLENQYATTGIIIRPGDYNPLSMRPWLEDPTATVEGEVIDWETRKRVYRNGKPLTVMVPPGAIGAILADDNSMMLRFSSPAAAIREWRRRIVDDRTYKGGVYNDKHTLAEMLTTYAPPGDVHPETGVDNAEIGYPAVVRTMLTRFEEMEDLNDAPEEEPQMAKKPRILLVAGHRSYGDGGNPVEREKTDDLAVAYYAAFHAVGYDVYWFQRDLDGDSDPTMTYGGLDAVALGCRRILADWARLYPDQLTVMLDLHYNGSHSPFHVIVPHTTGLHTAYSNGTPPGDTAQNNTLDVALGEAIAQEAVAATGLRMYRGALGVAGIMIEPETGVGLDGYRLAMFAATAPSQATAVRLVIEHGGTSDDPNSQYETFAHAALRAVDRVFEVMPEPQEPDEPQHPEPEPPASYAQPVPPSFWNALTAPGATHAEDNGTIWVRTDAWYRTKNRTKRQQFAVGDDRIVGPWIEANEEFKGAAAGQSVTDKGAWLITPWLTRVDMDDLEYIGYRAPTGSEEAAEAIVDIVNDALGGGG